MIVKLKPLTLRQHLFPPPGELLDLNQQTLERVRLDRDLDQVGSQLTIQGKRY